MPAKKVYLDHNIWNAVAAPEHPNWRDSKWSKLLLPMIASGDIEVFVSPASVFELVLFNDSARRHKIAEAMNSMIKGLHMLPASEYIIAEEILAQVNSTWTDSVDLQYFSKLKDSVTIVYIGLLGQLAALEGYEVGKSGYATLLKSKFINLIIHLKIIENPRFEIQRRIDQFEGTQVKDPYLEGLMQLSITQLEAEVDRLSGNIKKADGNTVQFVTKNKKRLLEGYSHSLVMESAGNIFKCTHERLLTVHNYKKIIENWNTIDECHKRSREPIPFLTEKMVTASKENKLAFKEYDEFFYDLFSRFNKCSLIATQSTEIIMNELINAIQSGDPPTKGLSMDSDHFVAAVNCDILISQDGRFYATCKKLFKEMDQKGIKKSVVASENEFLKALKG